MVYCTCTTDFYILVCFSCLGGPSACCASQKECILFLFWGCSTIVLLPLWHIFLFSFFRRTDGSLEWSFSGTMMKDMDLVIVQSFVVRELPCYSIIQDLQSSGFVLHLSKFQFCILCSAAVSVKMNVLLYAPPLLLLLFKVYICHISVRLHYTPWW